MAVQTGVDPDSGGDAGGGDIAVVCFATAGSRDLVTIPELAILIRSLVATPGVQSAQFSPNKPHVLVVQYGPAQLSVQDLLQTLQGNGHEFRLVAC